MVKVIEQGNKIPTTQVKCYNCKSVLEVANNEWRDGDYGSERIVSCPVCSATLVKPGSEYTGDF